MTDWEASLLFILCEKKYGKSFPRMSLFFFLFSTGNEKNVLKSISVKLLRTSKKMFQRFFIAT